MPLHIYSSSFVKYYDLLRFSSISNTMETFFCTNLLIIIEQRHLLKTIAEKKERKREKMTNDDRKNQTRRHWSNTDIFSPVFLYSRIKINSNYSPLYSKITRTTGTKCKLKNERNRSPRSHKDTQKVCVKETWKWSKREEKGERERGKNSRK